MALSPPGGDDILINGDGTDRLLGGDMLFGRLGGDWMARSTTDDLLLAGFSSFDEDVDALALIRAELISARSYAERIADLSGTASEPLDNGDIFLISRITVFGGEAVDRLNGNADVDWFLFTLFEDNRHDQASGEYDA